MIKHRVSSRFLPLCLLLALASGCFPDGSPKPLTGPLGYDEASKFFMKKRAAHGPRYKVDLEWNGKPFVANWELGTALERKQQLQIKPSTDEFSITELCMALEVALNDHEHCPWHPVIFDAVLSGFRGSVRAQSSVLAGNEKEAPPYVMDVWVKNNGSEWFCQVKGFNAIDPKKDGGLPN